MVFLLSYLCRLNAEFLVYRCLVYSVEHHLALLVCQFVHLVVELVVLVNKLIQLVVEWSSTHLLACVVYPDGYLARLKHDWHNALVVHEEVYHSYSVEDSVEMKLSMHNVARVDVLQLVVLDGFQV